MRGSSTVEFVPMPPPPAPPPVPPNKEPLVVVWPTVGFDPERTRFAPGSPLTPPFRRLWTFRGRSLREFPPAIAYDRLYLASNASILFAVDSKTGKGVWHYSSGRCVAASPAVADGVVYESLLNRPPCNTTRKDVDGRVVALDAKTGTVRWSGKLRWSQSTGGYVYGSPAVWRQLLLARRRDRRRPVAVQRTARFRARRRSCTGSSTSRP